MKTFLAQHLSLVEKWVLCVREDLFFAFPLILVENGCCADVKTFFCSSPNCSGKMGAVLM